MVNLVALALSRRATFLLEGNSSFSKYQRIGIIHELVELMGATSDEDLFHSVSYWRYTNEMGANKNV